MDRRERFIKNKSGLVHRGVSVEVYTKLAASIFMKISCTLKWSLGTVSIRRQFLTKELFSH